MTTVSTNASRILGFTIEALPREADRLEAERTGHRAARCAELSNL